MILLSDVANDNLKLLSEPNATPDTTATLATSSKYEDSFYDN